MKQLIISQVFEEERALYGLDGAEITACSFEGPADGESALKECRRIKVHNCRFALRYPLWHVKDFSVMDCRMTESCRAPLWYSDIGALRHCYIDGVKALRECNDIIIEDSVIHSPEFGWNCGKLRIRNSSISSEYFLLNSHDIEISGLKMNGKYSFQYVNGMTVSNSILDTKDAFWHAKNVTVTDSEINGEYLGWYSEGLTLINCKIKGTQPLCYCKDLRLVNCTMEDADLSFENSEVEADIVGDILSVKNPRSGTIRADGIGEIIEETPLTENTCKIFIR